MISKKEIISESSHVYGKDNFINTLKNPKRMLLKDLLIKKGMWTYFEERITLKGALRRRKIDFKEDSHNGELVGLAMDNNVNFKKLIY